MARVNRGGHPRRDRLRPGCIERTTTPEEQPNVKMTGCALATKSAPNRRKRSAQKPAPDVELAKAKVEARARIEVAEIEAETTRRKAWLDFAARIILRALWVVGATVAMVAGFGSLLPNVPAG